MSKSVNPNNPVFYVYVYLDPRKPGHYVYGEYEFDHEPFYVGKGSNGRMYDHLRCEGTDFTDEIEKIQTERHYDPLIMKYKETLTEKQAYKLEGHMIDTIGRMCKETGPLYNRLRSGDEPIIRRKRPDKDRMARSIIEMLKCGKTYREIQKELGISLGKIFYVNKEYNVVDYKKG
jgi:hypothetical protein